MDITLAEIYECYLPVMSAEEQGLLLQGVLPTLEQLHNWQCLTQDRRRLIDGIFGTTKYYSNGKKRNEHGDS